MRERDARLPALPLVLCAVPPGLTLVLGQEGVPTVQVAGPGSEAAAALAQGRFVLYDSQAMAESTIRRWLVPGQVAIDVNRYRLGRPLDPFRALVSTESAHKVWPIGGFAVGDQMSKHDKAAIRVWLVDRVRRDVVTEGGVWARLSVFPCPFRSAFNLRIDLDEPAADDYARFATARRPLDHCSTHFVSTAAYGRLPGVLADLRGVDTQSHGHYHHVYRDLDSNRRNLERAHALLVDSGFAPAEGFAGPHGRWNTGIDRLLEAMGYRYSSDFQLGYDDRPFYPWRGDRFSEVLQIPVHPLCEGAFFEAGADPKTVEDHLVATIRAAIDHGEPAFVYGHPEGRLGRHPRIVSALADAVVGEDLVWQTSLTEFARWWRWRAARVWSLDLDSDDRMTIHLDQLDRAYPLAIEVVRDHQTATIRVDSVRMSFQSSNLVYERRAIRPARPLPITVEAPRGVRAAIRSALDWETVTPIADIPTDHWAGRLKSGLRWWKTRSTTQLSSRAANPDQGENTHGQDTETLLSPSVSREQSPAVEKRKPDIEGNYEQW